MQIGLKQGALTQSVPVGCIYAVGLNYAKHIDEMQSQKPTEPVIFLKPSSALLPGGGTLPYPAITQCLHHEVEMVLLLGQPLWQASLTEAEAALSGVGVGLDLTLRDRQSEAKQKGRPWAIAKGFAGAAPVSDFYPIASQKLQSLNLQLHVNGDLRQQGNTQDMLFSCLELIQYLSTVFKLQPGDLIFTGTPEGVSELKPGDKAVAELGDFARLVLQMTGPEPKR